MDKANEASALDTLFKQLDGYLKRNSDRELFGLKHMDIKQLDPDEKLEEI